MHMFCFVPIVSFSKSYSYLFLSRSVVTESLEHMRNWESRDYLSPQATQNLLEETEAKWKEVLSVDSPKCCRSTEERPLKQTGRSGEASWRRWPL